MTRQPTTPPDRPKTLVTGRETGGRLALIELHEAAGHEPPCHVHAHEDEIVYVRAGRLTFFIGDQPHPAAAGACLVLPRGIEHGYVVESETASLLVALTPAGMEGFFQDDGGDGSAGTERLIAAAARYGVTITGPPPRSQGPD